MSAKRDVVRVVVSGGFDPVHVGHLRMLEAARALGDHLTVVVNNDNWLRTKKGYVFMPESERVELLTGFACVDRVMLSGHVPNDADRSVCRELQSLRPDIFANGGDRVSDNVPEVQLCKELGIHMHFNVGGEKAQSSSWVIADAIDAVKTTHRPWGSFRDHQDMPGVHLKTLHVEAGCELSLQRHARRAEEWILVSGDAYACMGNTLDDLQGTTLVHGVPVCIPAGMIHRLGSKGGAALVEIAYGDFDENDIERFEDKYGRV